MKVNVKTILMRLITALAIITIVPPLWGASEFAQEDAKQVEALKAKCDKVTLYKRAEQGSLHLRTVEGRPAGVLIH